MVQNLVEMAYRFGNQPSLGSQVASLQAQRTQNALGQQALSTAQAEQARAEQTRQLMPQAVRGDPNALAQLAGNDPALYMQMTQKLAAIDAEERKQVVEQATQLGRFALMNRDNPQALAQMNIAPEQVDQAVSRAAMLDKAFFEVTQKEQEFSHVRTDPKTGIAYGERGGRMVEIPGARMTSRDPGGASPYYQFLPVVGPDGRPGYAVGDARTGTLQMGAVTGADGAPGGPVAPAPYSPELQGEIAGAKTSAQELEKARGEWRANETKLMSNIQRTERRNKIIEDTIDRALPLLSRWSTSFGGLVSKLPATESKRLNNLLTTIKANVGFAELQAMRDASPTGGALGQVSNFENELLQATVGSLDQMGDMEDIRTVLQQIRQQRQGAVTRLKQAYEMDRRRYGSSFAPQEATPREATPPTTVPDMNDARQAPDGFWYVPDPNRPGGYLRVEE